MRLFELTVTDQPMYKGMSKNPEIVPDDAWEQRTAELKGHIADWQRAYDKLPDKETPYAYQTKYKIDNMKQELADFDEIGEIPFTFYAAYDKENAEFFSDQFEDGEVHEVRVTAKNVATVDDLRALGFNTKQTVSHLTPMMVHKLKKAGFDGATGIIDRLNGDEVVVFSPEQVKIVEGVNTSLKEGISPIVYHYMGIRNAASVLQQNKFRLTASPGTGAEKALQKGDRMYYLSTTRHKLGGYHIDNSWSGVIFELDGSKLAQNHAGKAVDYWGPEFYGQPGGKGPEKKEAEDRVYSYEPYIENANRYIKSVHVLYDEKGQESHKQMAIDVRRMFITAKRMGVPAYLYTDKQDWLVHDTRKAVNPADVPVIAQAKGGERDKGKTYGNATTRRQISPWVELYMAPVGSKISKEAEKTRYNYVLYGYSDAAQSLSADIHNAKSKPADETGLGTLLKIFRKEKIKSPQEYLDLLKDKWAPKDES